MLAPPMRPRYADLFRRMRDPDPVAADAAFDAVLFDREEAIPDLVECFQKSRKDPLLRFLCVQLLGFSEHPLLGLNQLTLGGHEEHVHRALFVGIQRLVIELDRLHVERHVLLGLPA